MGDWNLQEWKMTEHQKRGGVEFAGLENDGRSRRIGITKASTDKITHLHAT